MYTFIETHLSFYFLNHFRNNEIVCQNQLIKKTISLQLFKNNFPIFFRHPDLARIKI